MAYFYWVLGCVIIYENHSRILGAPVKVDGSLSVLGTASVTSGTVNVGFMEITEFLEEGHSKCGTPSPSCIEVKNQERFFLFY